MKGKAKLVVALTPFSSCMKKTMRRMQKWKTTKLRKKIKIRFNLEAGS